MTLDRFHPRRFDTAPAGARAAWRDRRGAVALLLGLAAIPLMLLVALAVDFGFISQARAQLNLAADTAALTAAKTAGATFTASTGSSAGTLAVSQGEAAGTAWFCAQVGTIPNATIGDGKTNCTATAALSVVVTQSNNAFTANVTYTATVTTIFGKLFATVGALPKGVTTVTISDTSSAYIVANAYVDVTFLLDNSSSMLIAATADGINTLQAATANSSTWQVTSANGNGGSPAAPSCPGSSLGTQGPAQVVVYTPAAGYTGSNVFAINSLQGCQCAFACHWQPLTGSTYTTSGTTFTGVGVDTESGALNIPATTQTYSLDYYGIARFTGVQLRFDVVQSAVQTAIAYMQTSEEIANQFGAAVYEFGNSLTQDWPPTTDTTAQAVTDMACLQTTASGCNGNALAEAQTISSPVTSDAANTDFPAAMSSLVTASTAAGDGSTQTTPKKSLIIITDGIQDWGGRNMVDGYSLSAGNTSNPDGAEGPISLQDCTAMKNLGYTIYVLYTTYITNPATTVIYNTQLVNYVNGATGTAYDLPTNLQGCASNQADYAEASSPTDIQTALQSMVQAALAGGATLSH